MVIFHLNIEGSCTFHASLGEGHVKNEKIGHHSPSPLPPVINEQSLTLQYYSTKYDNTDDKNVYFTFEYENPKRFRE